MDMDNSVAIAWGEGGCVEEGIEEKNGDKKNKIKRLLSSNLPWLLDMGGIFFYSDRLQGASGYTHFSRTLCPGYAECKN